MFDIIDGHIVEKIPATDLKVGDTIANPYSQPFTDRWVPVTVSQPADNGLHQIGTMAGSDNVDPLRTYSRRIRAATPVDLLVRFDQGEALESNQAELLMRHGLIQQQEEGQYLLTQAGQQSLGGV